MADLKKNDLYLILDLRTDGSLSLRILKMSISHDLSASTDDMGIASFPCDGQVAALLENRVSSEQEKTCPYGEGLPTKLAMASLCSLSRVWHLQDLAGDIDFRSRFI